MDNYIMLNGKKIPLTPEQVKLIQTEKTEKSPFDRVEKGETYYYVEYRLDVKSSKEYKV